MYHEREGISAYYIVIIGLSGSTTYRKEYRFGKCTKQRMYVLNMYNICFKHSYSQNNNIRTFKLDSFTVTKCNLHILGYR